MEKDSEIKIKELRVVDGGATANNLLLQIQANMAKIDIIRPKVIETTAQGVAFLAGLATGYWKNLEEIKKIWESDKVFNSQLDKNVDILQKNWSKAIEQVRNGIRMNRCTMLQNLQSNKGIWDILIISSGATGLGIAVDAAIEVLKPCY